jgi:hypothetical protein
MGIVNFFRDAYDAITGNYAYAGSSQNPPPTEEGECGTLCTLTNTAKVLYEQYGAMAEGYQKSTLSDDYRMVYERTTFGSSAEKGCMDYFAIDKTSGETSQETVCCDDSGIKNAEADSGTDIPV